MIEKGDISSYFQNNYFNNAISIYALNGEICLSKEERAKEILSKGIKLSKKIREVINPRGLVRNMREVEEVITRKEIYLDKDICNIIVCTPEKIALENKEYFLGYPKDNVSGYRTAAHQKNYDCLMTDYLEKEAEIKKEFIVGYYYQDADGNSYFEENKDFYALMDKTKKDVFFSNLLNKFDNHEKIDFLSDIRRNEMLTYIKKTIKERETDNNSLYLTALEYMEEKGKKGKNVVLNKEELIEIINNLYKDYSLYLHGVDQNPDYSLQVVKSILRSDLAIDEFYGFSGTCEPRGPIDEMDNLESELDYHYGDNKERSYNLIILIPKVLEDLDNNRIFMGYSRKNTSGTFPKSMKDFNCVLSDIINENGYVPKEFIFGYHVYGPDIEDKIYINKDHISFFNDDLIKIFGTDFFNVKNPELKKKIDLFNMNNICEDLLYSYAHPLIERRIMTSLQTTSLEYFEYTSNNKVKRLS